MSAVRTRRTSPAAALTILCVLVLLLAPVQPLRLLCALALHAVLPGWVMTDHDVLPTEARVVLSIALSLATTTAVALLLFYLGWWSWPVGSLTVAALVLLAGLRPRGRRP